MDWWNPFAPGGFLFGVVVGDWLNKVWPLCYLGIGRNPGSSDMFQWPRFCGSLLGAVVGGVEGRVDQGGGRGGMGGRQPGVFVPEGEIES